MGNDVTEHAALQELKEGMQYMQQQLQFMAEDLARMKGECSAYREFSMQLIARAPSADSSNALGLVRDPRQLANAPDLLFREGLSQAIAHLAHAVGQQTPI